MLPVINSAEKVNSKTRCQVLRISKIGYGYLAQQLDILVNLEGVGIVCGFTAWSLLRVRRSYHPFLEKQSSTQPQYKNAMVVLIVIAPYPLTVQGGLRNIKSSVSMIAGMAWNPLLGFR